jgi:two-component system, chemotaxis family, CheB/CheR fusion protein
VESERKFKQLAELMPQKVWTADAKGNKNYFNKTLLDYAGLSLEELKGEGWKRMIHPDDWEQDKNKWEESVSEGQKYQSESRFLRNDGEYLWHLTLAVPLKDEQDNIILWIGCKTDIQEQKEKKERLQHAVEERTLELKQANEELVKINKELEAFTYVSSHDLQEPLRQIQTFAGRLLEKENQNLTDSGKNYFHLMRNAAERMQTLIQDLLTFSRISIADRKFEITDLNIIIEEVKKELKDAIAEKNAVIEVKEICKVKIIPFQFRQLMNNLISNALKFSNPAIPPHIIIDSQNIKYSEINIASQNDNVSQANLTPNKEYCHISISDNGIGFETEYAEKIFEVFQKLHAKDEYAGTGIGLAIVKKIIENHNGFIFATSKLNIGTTFDIYIPR